MNTPLIFLNIGSFYDFPRVKELSFPMFESIQPISGSGASTFSVLILYHLLCTHRSSVLKYSVLYPSYDQWDPCGEGEQLQVPRCKHLRRPNLDYTHPNTGEESQAKAVPSATAEEIQGLTSYPENFLFKGHRKCTDSVHLSVVW